MDSLGTFFKKRYLGALGFALPIIIGCGLLAVGSNALRARGVSQEVTDFISISAAWILLIIACVPMFARRSLKGPLGAWQNMWQKIPTWSQRQQKKP